MDKKKKVFSFEKPEENPGFLMWQVTMLWQRKMKQGLDTVGLTLTQFSLLAGLKWLSFSNEEVYQINVANNANVDKMMTSKIFKNLIAKGIVGSAESKSDKRAKTVYLTDKGEKLFEKAIKIVEQVDARFFSSLQSEESKFIAIMNRLRVNNDVLH